MDAGYWYAKTLRSRFRVRPGDPVSFGCGAAGYLAFFCGRFHSRHPLVLEPVASLGELFFDGRAGCCSSVACVLCVFNVGAVFDGGARAGSLLPLFGGLALCHWEGRHQRRPGVAGGSPRLPGVVACGAVELRLVFLQRGRFTGWTLPSADLEHRFFLLIRDRLRARLAGNSFLRTVGS